MICASGYRASVGASILRSAGFTQVDWVADGFDAWAEAGLPAEWGGSAREAAGGSHDHPEASPSH